MQFVFIFSFEFQFHISAILILLFLRASYFHFGNNRFSVRMHVVICFQISIFAESYTLFICAFLSDSNFGGANVTINEQFSKINAEWP